MNKSMKFLTALLVSAGILFPLNSIAAQGDANNVSAQTDNEKATTRSDAVIFKVHNIEPVSEDGVVKGCNFMLTLYNRTSINFRTFTLNMNWPDKVDERFKFERYVESLLGPDEAMAQRTLFQNKDKTAEPMKTSITVNAFGTDKQISIRSYLENEKCYLMLSKANFSVTPCEIVRNMENIGNVDMSGDKKECTSLFQYVGTDNPEYFKEFKRISLTEQDAIDQSQQADELSEIDVVIDKIVKNMGSSDDTLTKIY